MRPFFLLLLCVVMLVCQLPLAAQTSAIDTIPYPTEKLLVSNFKKVLGEQEMAFTSDVRRAKVYLAISPGDARLAILSNMPPQGLEGSYRGRLFDEPVSSQAIRRLLGIRDPAVDVFRTQIFLPFYGKYDFFRAGTLDSFKNVTVISMAGLQCPAYRGRAEIRPGMGVVNWTKIDQYKEALLEEKLAPAEISAVSLLNNRQVNEALEKVFADFKTIRTVDELNRAMEKSRHKTVCLFAQVEENRLVRYTSDGSISYRVPLTQFLAGARVAEKNLFVAGINFADNPAMKSPKGPIDVAEELALLEQALQAPSWGEVLLQWGRQGRDTVVVASVSNPEFDCHNAAVQRWSGDSIVHSYNLVFYQTPFPKPAIVKDTLSVLENSGWVVLILSVFQLLLFWEGKHPGLQFFKWANLVALIVFLFLFVFYFLVFR